MHSKRRYKISICSVILGKLNTFFSKLRGLQYYVRENLRCNLERCENENLFYSSLRHIFEPKIFRFSFFYQK